MLPLAAFRAPCELVVRRVLSRERLAARSEHVRYLVRLVDRGDVRVDLAAGDAEYEAACRARPPLNCPTPKKKRKRARVPGSVRWESERRGVSKSTVARRMAERQRRLGGSS